MAPPLETYRCSVAWFRGVPGAALVLSIVLLVGSVVWKRVTGQELGAMAERRLGAVEVALQAVIGVAMIAILVSSVLLVPNDS
jgi:uncharacterized membrane protein